MKSEKSDGVALSEISVDNIRSSSFQSGFAMQILSYHSTFQTSKNWVLNVKYKVLQLESIMAHTGKVSFLVAYFVGKVYFSDSKNTGKV